MSIARTILKALATPDNQGRDWYGWASNQLSHAFIGAFIAILWITYDLRNPMYAAAYVIIVKKVFFDFVRAPVLATLKDAWQDAAFWIAGAVLVGNVYNREIVAWVSFAGASLLLSGVIERTLRTKGSPDGPHI